MACRFHVVKIFGQGSGRLQSLDETLLAPENSWSIFVKNGRVISEAPTEARFGKPVPILMPIEQQL
jgi:hypothetical protein